MSSKKVIVYNRKNPESVKEKYNAKKANPNATVVESSNKKALKEALKGKNEVINCDPKLDKRHLKLDVVENKPKAKKKKATKKKKAAPKKKAAAKKVAPKKVAPKKAAPKKAAAKK